MTRANASDEPGLDRSPDATARESTRGVAVIMLAKAWFVVTGFAQPLLLTRFLGTEGFGLYGVVLNSVSILNNVVVAGSIQAMSHAVTEGGASALRRGILIHIALGALLGGGFALAAGLLGRDVLHDPSLPPLLRVGSIVVANYTVYAALVGALNGRRRFVAQAGLDMTFAALRTGLILVAAWAFGVRGALSGFALASGIILVTALALTSGDLRGRAEASAPREDFAAFSRKYLRFFAPVLVYQLALNLVLQVDLLVLKGTLARVTDATPEAINRLAGVYKAAQTFAFLPYQLMIAVTFVAFPVVSRATLDGDRETTRSFVHGAVRFSAMALGAALSVLAGLPLGVLRLAYKPEFHVGAGALRVLALGQGAFTLSVIGTTIILAAGRTGAATGLMAFTLAAVVAGDVAGILLSSGGVSALVGTAAGTATACALGLAAVGVYVHRNFGGFIALKTALRVALCTVVAAFAAGSLPLSGKVGTLIAAAVTVAIYAALLIVTGELGSEEAAMARRIVARRRGK